MRATGRITLRRGVVHRQTQIELRHRGVIWPLSGDCGKHCFLNAQGRIGRHLVQKTEAAGGRRYNAARDTRERFRSIPAHAAGLYSLRTRKTINAIIRTVPRMPPIYITTSTVVPATHQITCASVCPGASVRSGTINGVVFGHKARHRTDAQGLLHS